MPSAHASASDSANASASAPSGLAACDSARDRYRTVRAQTESLIEGLSPEDMVIQSMEDASPTKWHLAHTTWFFEQFILGDHCPGYRTFDPDFGFLFNSYYVGAGPRHARPRRGMLSRPPVERVLAYRAHVDMAMAELLTRPAAAEDEGLLALVTLGLNHEQQHQELLLTDLLHALSCNPLDPAYRTRQPAPAASMPPLDWIEVPGGIHEIGHDGTGFAFDHEGPRHEVLLQPCRLASRLVTNGEWQAFIADGGYRRPALWLSDGWATAEREGWQAPGYWEERDGVWHSMTLNGLQPIEEAAPVCHISGYEADAYARWAGKRLPTEQEWEVAAQDTPTVGNTVGSGLLRPAPASGNDGLQQLYGDCWEWTASAYGPYPRYRVPDGTVGEYNGKFMANQLVLRGASCVTPDGHSRASYRNFFYPHQRWQFMGLRLAEDA